MLVGLGPGPVCCSNILLPVLPVFWAPTNCVRRTQRPHNTMGTHQVCAETREKGRGKHTWSGYFHVFQSQSTTPATQELLGTWPKIIVFSQDPVTPNRNKQPQANRLQRGLPGAPPASPPHQPRGGRWSRFRSSTHHAGWSYRGPALPIEASYTRYCK